MNRNKLKELRASNLKLWFSDKSVPPKEKSYISQLVNGRAPFGEKSARRLERDYGMPEFYLDKINDNEIYGIKQNNQHHANNNNYVIEILDITASAGAGYLNSDVMEVIKLIEYDSEQAKILFKGVDTDNLKVINISGDSMQGTFESGDSIYVDVSKKEFNGDGIYVFTFGKSLYVKRLQVIKDKLIVISDNKKYKEWDINEDEIDQLYIHGKVMLSQSMLLRKHG
ncbi:helix-turn-helix transcriptional regulator [Gilliamella sp. B2776]|uniref:S24 family peptidase n=1 Tax=unclassified Gilliamella TaxID=2685620 RepID=UPI00226AA67C|nr:MULTISPECIES: S24 family peptidase [unclassified Gilliamella]MCX8649962.1 helix-turn-helix transcriptional regulator [Gilliamella sp. B2779]MCX8653894.1 helix-turn-helix transcriptional regulator [Gilliamella sp. B2737]MCX8691735.1 helix-turn-helix transcriptional regulator [Gilliamella sp. B2776]MCX8701238.1 helix-turn-helix transcriptional regulator [Gilliamella sp. B2840]MCX8703024.1 helix-turn-helix transcriptional regulator [Gilliamella sp. B2781]